ncbi:unnamed protein product [Anisakis simplex]|uniref:Uncharacterized protein n=1 Tax=Anisakis simplex TaxID=6269 RepID=A0A0M3KDJ9_ANISI|nr:unnamed protein product [Anisakis simplex]
MLTNGFSSHRVSASCDIERMHYIYIFIPTVLLFTSSVRTKNPLFPRCPLFDKCAVIKVEGRLLCDGRTVENAGPQFVELWEDVHTAVSCIELIAFSDSSVDDLISRVQVNSSGTFAIEGRAQEFFTEGLGLFLKVYSTCGIKPRYFGKCWQVEEITIPNEYWKRLVYNDWDVLWKEANINVESDFTTDAYCQLE